MPSEWPFVGRHAEIGALRSAFERAAGEPAAVLISGEAGIGKTRLVTELTSTLPDGGVVWGRCMELAGEPIVFAAVEEALEQVALTGTNRAPDESSRLAQFGEWAGQLEEPDRSKPPRVFVVEDIHWADDSTIDFLAYLVRSLRRYRLLVVLTRRNDDDLPPSVAKVVVELGRLPWVESVPLVRLSPSDAIELQPDTAPATALGWYELAGGNPYLLSELVAAGGDLPAHVRDLLMERVRRLDADAQALTRLAAVAGAVIPDDLLWEASAFDEDRHAAAVRRAVRGGVLRVEQGSYVFRHSLTRQAVLDDLVPFEAKRHHAALASAIESTADDSPVTAARVAAHWHAAGNPDRTFAASLEAARLAFAANAFSEAWHHYRRALELLEPIKAEPVPGTLLVRAAEAARWAGDASAGVDLLRQAVALVSDPVERAGLHERLGRYLWEAGSPGSHEQFATATRLLEVLEPVPAQATVLAAQSRASILMTRYRQAANEADRALSAARRWALPAVEADALNNLALAEAGLGEPDRAIDHLRRALSLAEESDDLETLCRTYSNLVFTLSRAAAHDETERVALAGLELLRARGLHLGNGATLATNAATILVLHGRYRQCEGLLADMIETDLPSGRSRQLYLPLALVQVRTGRIAEARDTFTLAAEALLDDEPYSDVSMAHVQSELLLAEDELDRAVAVVLDALDRLEGSEDTTLDLELCEAGLRAAADRESQRAEPSPEADAQITQLAGHIASAESAGSWPSKAASLARARAEEARARHRHDPDIWAEAADEWHAVAQPWDEAYCRLREAEDAARNRLGQRAAAALVEARRLARELGAKPLLAEADDLARRARLPAASRVRPAPASDASAIPFGLTRREYEICLLLAEGATNREIATRLFISERTASTHMSNILRKLSVRSRLEAGLMVQAVAGRPTGAA